MYKRQALEIERAAYPAGHPGIALGLRNLAGLLMQKNEFAEAEPLMREALEIYRAALPAGHPDIASVLEGLVRLYEANGNASEAAARRSELDAARAEGGKR